MLYSTQYTKHHIFMFNVSHEHGLDSQKKEYKCHLFWQFGYHLNNYAPWQYLSKSPFIYALYLSFSEFCTLFVSIVHVSDS